MSDRRILVIDTATHAMVTGVAVIGAAGVTVAASRVVADQRRHAETLTSLMRECLDESGWRGADLDAVVVGCGPGPFTGLRVGMATAAAYGDALGIPVYGVCSLDAIAAAVGDRAASSVLVVTDARRREVYSARYADGERVDGPGVMAPAALLETLDGASIDLVAGVPALLPDTGWDGVEAAPDVAGLAAVAAPAVLDGEAPEPLVPLYLRRPDAVELADQKKKRATP
ncbi:tRNA (adenosine(37)-N6)-threonylcarbamoyltransferase complex dimerization subunit type 1 TsaB [Gordonia crocea]|uniref:tRNA (Adenosine(37)-N6)-threonylcarbamoyltransferase complex dimerization subunit type 1 TsaB n=1 Tax=Gordonia crocea TaxID=589162 RepID=A0A7I9UW76_9ACTN|nr:tRNA (adenosine(37)-N6)-threonylcarbamoyltransferase complex dimerization subunit type 1 TsaB [Gordonia crocea]GED97239.1 tRNA (adenosine(37)-N6)-threonylcarbamoyltransferase complex dimerization subunit type 1 TsaB [Gordonia crocea]